MKSDIKRSESKIKPINILLIFLVLVFLYSMSQAQVVKEVNLKLHPSVTEVSNIYKSLNKITKQPAAVDPIIAFRCISITPTQEEVEIARFAHGPHANAWIDIYMNDLAKTAFLEHAKSYPQGSVIVKQKLIRSDLSKFTKTETKDFCGVGGMIKRPAGFNPLHGDWEYFYFDDKTKIESGRIQSCVNCHDSAIADCVFGTWNDSQEKSLKTILK